MVNEKYRMVIDDYLAEHFEPEGDAERDYRVAWARAFGEKKYFREDEEKPQGLAGAFSVLGSIAAASLGGDLLAKEKIDKMLAKQADTFSDLLFVTLKEYNIRTADLYKRANLTKELFSKIKHNRDYHPKRETVLAILIALLEKKVTRARGRAFRARRLHALRREPRRSHHPRAHRARRLRC